METRPADVDVELGMEITEMSYLDLTNKELHQLRKDLTSGGTGLLFVGLGISVGALLFLGTSQHKPCSAYTYALGGLLSILLVLRKPLNPVRVGHRFTRWPDELSPYEVVLRQLITHFRSSWVIIVASAVSLLLGVIYGGGDVSSLINLNRCITNGSGILFVLLGFTQIGVIAGGVDFLYVAWKLREVGNGDNENATLSERF